MYAEREYREILKHFEPCEDLGMRRRELLVQGLVGAHYVKPFDTRVYRYEKEPLPDVFERTCHISCDTFLGVGYKTGSGNVMSLVVEGYTMPREEVPTLSVLDTSAACGPCKGSSGGCPGFAPRFEWLAKDKREVFVITVNFDMAWALKYSTPNKYGIINCLSYADRLTENYTRRLAQGVKKLGGGMYLGLGNCFGCRPKMCTVIRGQTCSKPDKRTFSCEATGINCDELHIKLYGHPLPWYYKGTNKLQTYMTRYVLFFKEPEFDYDKALQQVAYADDSYTKPVQAPNLPTEVILVPKGRLHAGSELRVYRRES